MTTSSDQVAAEELQGELRDLLCLAVVGDHVRWVLTGDDSTPLAEWLTSGVVHWREWADQVARQLVRLGVAPDGRVRALAKDIPFNWVPDGWLSVEAASRLVADRVGWVASWAGDRKSQATDVEIVRLLDTVCSGLQSQVASLPVTRQD